MSRPTALALSGLVVILLIAATGCSRPTTHHRPGTSHDTATGPVAAATQPPDEAGSDLSDLTLRFAIADGKVRPAAGRIEVEKGDRLAIIVTSDVADELRVAGLAQRVELPAGRATRLSFVADRPGRFTVATSDTGQVLTELVVR